MSVQNFHDVNLLGKYKALLVTDTGECILPPQTLKVQKFTWTAGFTAVSLYLGEIVKIGGPDGRKQTIYIIQAICVI